MKAISIKQPWASLIAHGIKDIENRTWKTNYRGKILIHASASWVIKPLNQINYGYLFSDDQWEMIRRDYRRSLNALLNPNETIYPIPVSAIIGEVDIVDCVINHSSIWAEKTNTIHKKPSSKDINLRGYAALKMYQRNKPIYNWVLANAVLYNEPILNVKGKLSFWEFEK